jgi:hypothetical protein
MGSMKRLALALALTACTSTTPDAPTTEGVASSAIKITASLAQSNGALVEVVVLVDANGAGANLAADDALVVRDGIGNTRTFDNAGGPAGEYEAALTTGEIALDIDFTRKGAVDRTIAFVLPAPFTLSAPATASRTTGVTITWGAGAAAMTFDASGAPCLPSYTSAQVADDGTLTLQAADFIDVQGSCDITLTATRSIGEALQVRTLTFGTSP